MPQRKILAANNKSNFCVKSAITLSDVILFLIVNLILYSDFVDLSIDRDT